MSNDLLVSVIMPSYNSAKTLERSILSVCKQSMPSWELIIVDDNSIDDSLLIARKYAELDNRVKIYSEKENRGAGYCRNKAIENSKGRFIAFLDSDDMWHEDKLKLQTEFMIKNNFSLTYTYYDKVDSDDNFISHIRPPAAVNYNELLKSNVIGCLTAMYDTKILGKVFMPLIRKRQDMALWLDILKFVDFAWCLDKSLGYYREGHQSLSSNKFKIIFSQWSFYRGYLKFGVLKSLWFFSFYIVRGLRKHKSK